ncbi:hypothetical protein L596_017589 [Steinernema carpocapsae]|uniref:DNA topoisomerase (ATP-hydrolyzing) n=1 Tax=Steinernema carpocapsae TaxID=34508 RepID=A0A4U5N246_STECR|nr:hypothetical protein L596_017589 [Steinernema carpocapsae]
MHAKHEDVECSPGRDVRAQHRADLPEEVTTGAHFAPSGHVRGVRGVHRQRGAMGLRRREGVDCAAGDLLRPGIVQDFRRNPGERCRQQAARPQDGQDQGSGLTSTRRRTKSPCTTTAKEYPSSCTRRRSSTCRNSSLERSSRLPTTTTTRRRSLRSYLPIPGGRNGFGAKLCNVFSSKFTLETSTKEYGKRFKQTWKDNMTKDKDCEISKATGEDFTKVTFTPDLAKFKMTQLDDDIIALMYRRAFDIAGSTKDVKVFLNEKEVPVHGFKQYVEFYMKSVFEGDEAPKLVHEVVARPLGGGSGHQRQGLPAGFLREQHRYDQGRPPRGLRHLFRS